MADNENIKSVDALKAELEGVVSDFARKMAAANRLRAGLEVKIQDLIAERDALRAELTAAKEALLVNDMAAVVNSDNEVLAVEAIDDEPFTTPMDDNG